VGVDVDAAGPPPGSAQDLRAASAPGMTESSTAEDDDWAGPDLAREDAPHEDEDAGLPTWHSPRPAPVEPTVAAPTPMPLVEPAGPTPASSIDPVADAPVNERIELAQAYLDLGDYDSARQLLGDVAVTGDHASKQRAMRMLRGIE
jgi:pilus assembly protein FimV